MHKAGYVPAGYFTPAADGATCAMVEIGPFEVGIMVPLASQNGSDSPADWTSVSTHTRMLRVHPQTGEIKITARDQEQIILFPRECGHPECALSLEFGLN